MYTHVPQVCNGSLPADLLKRDNVSKSSSNGLPTSSDNRPANLSGGGVGSKAWNDLEDGNGAGGFPIPRDGDASAWFSIF